MTEPLSDLDIVPPSLLTALHQLIVGHVVEVWGADPERCRAGLVGALDVQPAKARRGHAHRLLMCPSPGRVADFLSDPDTAAALEAGMTVAVWSTTTTPQPQPIAPYAARYLHRALTGSLLRDARFGLSRVAALHELVEPAHRQLHLLLWSKEPIPLLRAGLYEGGAVPVQAPDAVAPRTRHSSEGRAAALAKRLLEVEDRTMSLRDENLNLKKKVAESGGQAQGSYFDVPRTHQPWPIAETERTSAFSSPYDRRPDDGVLVEARRGAAFMGVYGLLGDTPDFTGAVAALNKIERTLCLTEPSPNISIIIPIYGQLPYTLNCLDSLFSHSSRYTAEIILVDDCSPDKVTAEFLPQIADVRYHRQQKNGGFIQSCNTGGLLAHGEYVLLLNSDTRVVEGWLDELLHSFNFFPKAGLVGSKMLYPDGVLQEAGGILWRDGSAWNYGRNDDPNRPQYCFARQVDYISGCSIALPTLLWRELGGFDPHYTPAYAEDADLCQRVRARGLEVWFQPTSRVVHYEGKTSGTSTSGGIKAYQVINLRKLFLRWRKRFEAHRRNGEAPFFEKEREVRKRILFVDVLTPTPDQDAGSLQTVLGLRCAHAAGYKAHFVPEDNWLFDPTYTPRLQREGTECAYAPFEVGFENYIRRYGFLFDAVVAYRVSVMHKCLPLLREYAPQALALFHVADLHYLRIQRQAELEGDADLMQAALDLKEKELDTVRRSDCTITHSTVEAGMLATEVPDAEVTVWPLMMDAIGTDVGFEARRDLCFLGGYRHPPNVDAVLFFVREVLPLIHAVQPDLRFIVAGANPTPELFDLADDKVIVTGMVENLADVFDSIRVFVCPLRVGAGAKGKVMSALSHGLPIVSTPIGIEGAGLEEGEHVLVAESAAAIAEAVLRLHHDPALWQRLSAAGPQLIRERFSLTMGVERLEEAMEKGYRKRLGLVGA